MKSLLRLLYTLRYLKGKQLAYRLYYRFRKLKPYVAPVPSLRSVLFGWSSPAYVAPSTSDGKNFRFLGKSARLSSDWNPAGLPKLWLYNLHYQDDLNAIGADERFLLHCELVDRWIEFNPPFQGNGWEPYCISLRVVNWVKWLSRLESERIKPEWVESLACQVDALDQQLEYHILGNHLFANAKALVFAGVFFGGQQGEYWLEKGLRLLDKELSEQFLSDGGHFERSPMYHAVLLWDLCDLIQLQEHAHHSSLNRRSEKLQTVLVRGMNWLTKMVHPDGDIAFFNDASFGSSPTLEDLGRYCKILGVDIKMTTSNRKNWSSSFLESSGYVVIEHAENHRAILDVAEIGPAYQPGHAHADTLSFELSLFGQRVFVNSGTSQYGMGLEREYQRSTRAHNTVEVDEENSSEVWAGFRVARRANPLSINVNSSSGILYVSASHDGYRRLPARVLTDRIWVFREGLIEVTDRLRGSWSSAVSRFYCHPLVNIEQLNESSIHLILPQGQKVLFSVQGASVLRVVDSLWHPRFGVSTSNQCIELVLSDPQLVSRINY